MKPAEPAAAVTTSEVAPSTLRSSSRISYGWAHSASADRSRSPATCNAISSSTRKWISKQDYVEGLALAQLAPGPLAAQLAIYLGWVRAGNLGATLVSAAFVLPSFLMVLALSAVYVRFGGLPWMQGVFYGIGAAVIAIIGRSAYKLVRMTLGRDRLCGRSSSSAPWSRRGPRPKWCGSSC